LEEDYNEIVSEFKKLVHATLKLMKEKEVMVAEFKTFLTIELGKKVSKIQGKSTIDKIFEVLHLDKYWSFFEYELLQAVIDQYCEKEMDHRVNDYLRKFGSYCERKLSEFPVKKLRSLRSGESYILYIKLRKDFDGITLKEVKAIECRLQKKFHTCLYKLRCFQGCVLLVFRSSHKLECFQYSKGQIYEDLKFEVLQLYINDYTYYESEKIKSDKFYLEQELSTVASSRDPVDSYRKVRYACGCVIDAKVVASCGCTLIA
jgi:hypothetical protein